MNQFNNMPHGDRRRDGSSAITSEKSFEAEETR